MIVDLPLKIKSFSNCETQNRGFSNFHLKSKFSYIFTEKCECWSNFPIEIEKHRNQHFVNFSLKNFSFNFLSKVNLIFVQFSYKTKVFRIYTQKRVFIEFPPRKNCWTNFPFQIERMSNALSKVGFLSNFYSESNIYWISTEKRAFQGKAFKPKSLSNFPYRQVFESCSNFYPKRVFLIFFVEVLFEIKSFVEFPLKSYVCRIWPNFNAYRIIAQN